MDIDLKKIRARLRSYERKFKKDPENRDGGGVRFLMGPYYLCLGDLEGAVSHYEWFWSVFSDSIDEPFHALGRVITELRQGHEQNAVSLLKRVYSANPYLLPFLLHMDIDTMDVHGHSNWEEKPYIFAAPEELYSYISEGERAWIRRIWDSQEFSDFVRTYNTLQDCLKTEPIGRKRSEMIDLRYKLIQE